MLRAAGGRHQSAKITQSGFLLFHFPEHAAEHASGLRDGASALAAVAGPDAHSLRLVFPSGRRLSAPDFHPDDAIEFWDMTNKQDWHVCELSQQGIASRAYQPGPYSPRESIPAAWDREYLRRMR